MGLAITNHEFGGICVIQLAEKIAKLHAESF